MGRYVCECTALTDTYFGEVVVNAGSVEEAERKAIEKWCGGMNPQCFESSHCECEELR